MSESHRSDCVNGDAISEFHITGSEHPTVSKQLYGFAFLHEAGSSCLPMSQYHSVSILVDPTALGYIHRIFPKSSSTPLGRWHWMQRAKRPAGSSVPLERRTNW